MLRARFAPAVAHRVLYLIDSLGMGGAERGLTLTVRHLDRAKVAPEVAFLWGPDTLAGEIEAAGVRIHRLQTRPGPAALKAVPGVTRLLKEGRFDAIHTQVLWASIVGRAAGWRAGVKVVSHIANVETGGFRDRELAPSIARKARIAAKLDELTGRWWVDRFVAISEAVRADPIRGRSWDRGKIDVVLRGQELDRLRAEAERETVPPLDDPGDPSILTVGRLSEQKGQRFLIEAMPAVLEALPRARLLVCGEGHLRAELQRRAAPLGDRVAFLGIRDDVPALARRASLFVFPSLWEGQGNALLEVMAVGAPIVATDIPSTRETLRDGEGVLVPPADAGALAAAIIDLLGHPDRARELAGAAARRADDYDIEATTGALESVYDRLLR
jgi:glycosyltransferase involved in cell wall biosynthesis